MSVFSTQSGSRPISNFLCAPEAVMAENKTISTNIHRSDFTILLLNQLEVFLGGKAMIATVITVPMASVVAAVLSHDSFFCSTC